MDMHAALWRRQATTTANGRVEVVVPWWGAATVVARDPDLALEDTAMEGGSESGCVELVVPL